MPGQNDLLNGQDSASNEGGVGSASPQPSASGGFEPITSQEQLDRIISGRLKRVADKYSDYDETKEKLKAFEESGLTVEQIMELSKNNSELKVRIQQSEWRDQVEKEFGVPGGIVMGSTLEEMQKHASSIKDAIESIKPSPKAPIVKNDNSSQGASTLTKEQILSIRDSSERKAAIAANLDLF